MSKVTCRVCPHACRLEEGTRGLCGARQALGDTVVSVNYGRCTALDLDPIEKKPLARFFPKNRILSYGSFGCNLFCDFCQNWEIARLGDSIESKVQPDDTSCGVTNYISSANSSDDVENGCISTVMQDDAAWEERVSFARSIAPEELVQKALALKNSRNIGVALTYNEPLICPEYCVDVAELAHMHDLQFVLVTNGYTLPQVAEKVFALTDAANIDLKGFNQDFYTRVGAPGGFATVKRTIQTALDAGCHVEVTTLIIPGLNDSPEEMKEEAAWLASLNPDIPLHISRFHPAYRMQKTPPTPFDTINTLARIAHEHLTYVYTGNMSVL